VVTWISAIQHVGVCAIFTVYPLIIAHQAALPADQITNILQLAFLALAVAALLQALPRGPVGSRFRTADLHWRLPRPSLLALSVGGLPSVWGMTVFAGLVEVRCHACGRACAVHSAGVGWSGDLPGRHHHRARRVSCAVEDSASGSSPRGTALSQAVPSPS
jgi:hypothetical protein